MANPKTTAMRIGNPRLKEVGDRLKLSPCQNCDILLAKRKKHRRGKAGFAN
ncbi:MULTISPECIES: hypothetical protein [Mesorhizobium]|uniref:hypothetical protein n=1 Tax=Mesorhizobium TaxID=68287 RepID=UPI001459FCB3|nr:MULTISPECIES: hypothetical protein [Mesorhizobium]